MQRLTTELQECFSKMTDTLIPMTRIKRAILQIRRQNVMLDRDLAELYGVSTKALKQAVRRNLERFPGDFMFELRVRAEITSSRSAGLLLILVSDEARASGSR